LSGEKELLPTVQHEIHVEQCKCGCASMIVPLFQ